MLGQGRGHYKVARRTGDIMMNSLYNEYMDDLMDIQGDAQIASIISDLTSMAGYPVIGEGIEVINTLVATNRINNLEDLNSQFGDHFRYSSEKEESVYYTGADDAAHELKAGLWSGLTKSLMQSYDIYGSDMTQVNPDTGNFEPWTPVKRSKKANI